MKHQLLFCAFVLFLLAGKIHAQDQSKVKFGAYARALNNSNTLGKEDTLNIDKTGTGHVLLDLGLHITPDKKTEILAIMRFKSDLNGFYGAGTSATLRQMYVRGIIGKYFNYQVGDLYLELSPFTFFNSLAEGAVNEATIFKDIRRDYTNYENLSNKGTAWWQQGFYSNVGLAVKDAWIDSIRVDGFVLRNRTTDFVTVPTRMHAGGKVTFTQSPKLKFALNYVNLFDIAATTGATVSVSNPVTSLELNYKLWNTDASCFTFAGETGYASLIFKGDSVSAKDDYFFSGGVKFLHKPSRITFGVGYSYVGAEYFSSAAQTKRVNFANTPSIFPVYGNDPINPVTRTPGIFDVVRDPSVYNAGITSQLMSYDPSLNNSQPYGKATPNRQGLNTSIQFADSAKILNAEVTAALLSDVIGEGSSTLKKYTVLRGVVDFNVGKVLGMKRRWNISAGYRFEHSKRGGDPLQAVNLQSNLFDVGFDIETFKRLDLLLGAKFLIANGNEFIAVRNQYNDIVNFDVSRTSKMNNQSLMYAIGFKFRFTERTYVTVQDHIFYYQDSVVSANDYSINQLLILFNMNF